MNLAGMILLGAGVFSVCGAVCDWDWFINSRKARAMVALLGRNGARAFYGLLGAVLSVVGLLGLLGIVDLAQTRR